MTEVLKITNLRLKIQNRQILNGIDFQLPKGKICALVGLSGSGKSSFVKSILGIETLSQFDSYFLCGEQFSNLQSRSFAEYRIASINYIGQSLSYFFHPFRSIQSQLKDFFQYSFGLPFSEETVAEELSQLGFANPKKILHARTVNVSGGERQRLALYVATYVPKPIYILDEPTSALDSGIAAKVMENLLVKKEKSQASILLLTHDIKTALEISDQISVMDSGKILEESSKTKTGFGFQNSFSQRLLENA